MNFNKFGTENKVKFLLNITGLLFGLNVTREKVKSRVILKTYAGYNTGKKIL